MAGAAEGDLTGAQRKASALASGLGRRVAGSAWPAAPARPGLAGRYGVPTTPRPAVRVQPPIRGKAGLAVAYWLCTHPGAALLPTKSVAELGFAPSTISTAVSALVEAGLVDAARLAVLPELFRELAAPTNRCSDDLPRVP